MTRLKFKAVGSSRKAISGLWLLPYLALLVQGCSTTGSMPIFGGVRDLNLRPAGQPSDQPQAANPVTADSRYQVFPPDEGDVTASVPRAESRGVTPASGGFEVNFTNADIATVAKSVLGDTLSAAYVIDPKVQGTITLSTAGTVSKDELLKILEAALQMNDASILNDGKHYRIVPGAVVKEGSPSGVFEPMRAGSRTVDGYGVSILPLRHVNAASITQLIEGFIARGGTVRATTRGNLLIARGTTQEREALVDLVETFDVDSLRNQAAGMAPLKNTDPNEMIAQLKKIISVDGDAQSAGLLRFEPLDRLNSVLILAPDTRQVRSAMTWISRLDQATVEGAGYYVYRVQNAKANLLAAILSQTFGAAGGAPDAGRGAALGDPFQPAGVGVSGGGATDSPPSNRATGGGGLTTASIGGTPASTGATANATKAADTAGGGNSDIRISANDASNTLIIRAPARVYRQILSVLREIDKPGVQVMINVLIAEVSLNDNLRYGVEAYLKGRGFEAVLSKAVPPLQPTVPGLNLILGNAYSPQVVLDALSSVTSVRVVSSPSVVALDNQLATIKVGDKIPITTQQVTSNQSAQAPTVNSIEYRDSGVILRVMPRVSQTNLVTMDISQELSAVAGDAGAAPSLTPTISQRTITSTIAVYSRQTVVLGGLISSQQNGLKNTVPLLNRVPVIGDLIGKTDETTRRTELVVFITPEVMRDAEDASRVSEEVRSRVKLLVGR